MRTVWRHPWSFPCARPLLYSVGRSTPGRACDKALTAGPIAHEDDPDDSQKGAAARAAPYIYTRRQQRILPNDRATIICERNETTTRPERLTPEMT